MAARSHLGAVVKRNSSDDTGDSASRSDRYQPGPITHVDRPALIATLDALMPVVLQNLCFVLPFGLT